jgi:hypothetical protein
MLNIKTISPEVLEIIASSVDANNPLEVLNRSIEEFKRKLALAQLSPSDVKNVNSAYRRAIKGVEEPLNSGREAVQSIRRNKGEAIDVLFIPTVTEQPINGDKLSDKYVAPLRFGKLEFETDVVTIPYFRLTTSPPYVSSQTFMGRWGKLETVENSLVRQSNDLNTEMVNLQRSEALGWTRSLYNNPSTNEVNLVTDVTYGYHSVDEYVWNLDSNGRRYPDWSSFNYQIKRTFNARDSEPTIKRHPFLLPKLNVPQVFHNYLIWKLKDGTIEST